MAGWIKMPLGREVGLGLSDIMLDGDPTPFLKNGGRALPPPKKKIGRCLSWPNGLMDQDGTWHVGSPQPRPHCARWGPISPPKKKHSPPFSAHIYRGQTAGRTKMALGMEIGLGPGHIVLHGHPALPQFSAHVCCDQTVVHLSYCRALVKILSKQTQQ